MIQNKFWLSSYIFIAFEQNNAVSNWQKGVLRFHYSYKLLNYMNFWQLWIIPRFASQKQRETLLDKCQSSYVDRYL